MTLMASAKSGTSFPPHPEEQYAAVCIDVIDRGIVETKYMGKVRRKHKCTIRFWCGEWFDGDDDKKHPLYVDAWFTVSLSEKSNLRPFLESWRGKAFTEEEVQGFDVETLLHAPAFIQVVHNKTPDRTYANIKSIMRLPKNMTAIRPLAEYVRVVDRPAEGEQDDTPEESAPSRTPFHDDDDLPF